jgi:tubulin beta
MCEEHRIDKEKATYAGLDEDRLKYTQKIGVYFENAADRYVARSVLVDLEPGTLNKIKTSSDLSSIYAKDAYVMGASGAGNNWAKGHYTDGAELVDEVLERLRAEIEKCEAPQGYQMTHSLGGGTGSGLGTLLLAKLRDFFPDRIACTYSVYPSPKVSDVVVESYNAILSIHSLTTDSDETIVIDNEALYNISHNVLQQKDPKYTDLNWVISLVMGGVTSSLRFSGKLNGDLRKMGVNLVPFPRLHFFLVAQAPLFSPGNATKVKLNIPELTSQMWSSRNFLANVKPDDGKYMTASVVYRGNDLSTQVVDTEVDKVQSKMSEDFVNWIPNNIKSSVINVPPNDVAMSGTFVANTTAIKAVFQRISTAFAKMYKRRAFLHWYKGEGMDEMEFQEADKDVRDLVTEYQDKQDTIVDLEKPGIAARGAEESEDEEDEEEAGDAEEQEQDEDEDEDED